MSQHRVLLGKNESATRYSLIDPLLGALGWDLSDPTQVEPEYQAGPGRADYALMVDGGTPSIIVEAKNLGRRVDDGISQSISYCIERGIKYFVVTNGDRWEVYETHNPVPIAEKLVVEFSVRNASQGTIMKMLWLWRGNFKSDTPAVTNVPQNKLAERGQAVATKRIRQKSVPLDQFTPSIGQKEPNSILFPDGSSTAPGTWIEFQTAIVSWLIETGHLSASDCPITAGGKAYLVHSQPVMRSGARFRRPRSVNDLWIEANRSASDHVKTAKRVLEDRGVTLQSVRVVATD